MTTQLNPPLPLWTPQGYAQAHLVIDYGMDQDLQWVCFLVKSGKCWTFLNKDVKLVDNTTMGRGIEAASSSKLDTTEPSSCKNCTASLSGRCAKHSLENAPLIRREE